MIKWAAGQYLYFLLLIPLIIVGYVIYFLIKRRTLAKKIDPQLIPKLTDTVDKRWQVLKAVLFTLGFMFVVLAVARPKWGETLQMYKGRGIDIVISIDASKSMLAEDIKPNRLARAKTEVAALIDNLGTNRVGITAFAGDCYVMCPLTTDMEAAKMFLDVISPDMIPMPGTDFAKAMTVSASLFDPKEPSYKALILITDGENLGENPMPVAQSVAEQGVKIFTVLIATQEGAPIPEKDQSGSLLSYKKDKEGQMVMSRPNENLLIIMSRLSGGRYYRSETMSLDNLTAELDRIKKKEIGGGEYTEYVERYQYFLLLGFILLFLGMFISDRKGKWFDQLIFWRQKKENK
jgi:Ca-activated chloride channel homolog